jgi:hypothetical protein
MVQRLLGLTRAPAQDAADALACAICHAHSSTLLAAVRATSASARLEGPRGAAARGGPARVDGAAPGGQVIGRIEGRLLEKNPPAILVDANGVGYEIDVPMSTFYNLPSVASASRAADAPGRARGRAPALRVCDAAERAAFRELIKISGVGARTALRCCRACR